MRSRICWTCSITLHCGTGCCSHASRATSSKPTEEQLKGRKAGRSLGHLSNTKEHVWQHEIPVTPIFHNNSTEHSLEGLIEALDQAVRLGVVDRCA